MRHELLEILACPLCKVPLDLIVREQEGEEILQGTLTCTRCREVYPIEDSIPNLLPPQLRA